MPESVDGFRLSPQQQRLWLLQQSAAAVFGAQCVVMIKGALRVGNLRQAVLRVVERQEILRTRFHRRPGIRIPIQVIQEVGDFSWDEFDLTGEDAARQRDRIEELFDQEQLRPFDFERDPVLRAALFTLSAESYALLLSLPALCADRLTLKNLVHEIGVAYDACLSGEEAAGDEVVQYLQFAEWQNELLETATDEDEGRAFWRTQETHSHTTLTFNLGERRAVASSQKFAPEAFAFTIAQAEVRQIDALARKHETTPEPFLLACWHALLWRLTGQAQTIVGQEFDGRKFEELERALGLYARMLPSRCDFGRDLSFAELLRRMKEAHRDAAAWQEYFIWDESAVAPEEGGEPFFHVVFDFHEQPAGVERAADLTLAIDREYACLERFHLRLSFIRKGDALNGELFYDPAFFDAKSIERMARHFQRLMSDALEDPSKRVSDLELLTPDDRRQLLQEFNLTAADYPQHECIHYLFEETARLYPHRVAVVFGEEQLTYAELDAKANRLAHYLRASGVGAGALVGLSVERSLDMMVGLLGIMKSGAAYVPLDPDQPQARLDYQLRETGARVLLTQEKLLPRLPEFAGEAVCLDRDETLYRKFDEHCPERLNDPAHPAYVIYTSGSTGAPKGVVVSHRNLSNYAWFISRRLELDRCQADAPLNFATVTTIAADLGNTCIFPSLITGGCLHILSYDVATDGSLFAGYVSKHPIDVLKIVPSHFGALLASVKDDAILPRRFLILGGEALSFDLIKRIERARPACRVINHYGPTETTIGSLVCDVDSGAAQLEAASASVPIGRPIANTVAYILDEKRRPVPVGIAGELFIGGAGVAHGYLNKPERTAEQFLPDPFSGKSGERFYKTGDLARFLPDGAIEFLGRCDHQVKIRGFRIEPGEIEAKLREHQAVRDALVIARDDGQGYKRLVAYIVGRRAPAPPASELRGILQQSLPDYMIPSAFVMLRALPLTPNGKIDRRALPEPGQERAEMEHNFAAPRTLVEEKLAGIWREVLGIARVGRQDNFFELGGDSILSLQIIARAHGEGIHLTPKQLFEHPTIASLAGVASDESNVTEGEPSLVAGDVPLTPIQRWFFEQNLSEPHHWNMSVLLDVRQPLDIEMLESAVEHLLAHHDALRLRYEREGDEWRQVNAESVPRVKVTRVDFVMLPDDERERAFEQDATRIQASMNLAESPLLRLAFFEMGAGEPNRLLLAVHHLVVDGVSWRILLEDLQTSYRQLTNGEAVKLPAKTSSFKSWAMRLGDYARGDALRQEGAYWLAPLRAPSTRLPLDKSRDGEAANTVASARSVTTEFDSETTDAFLHTALAAYSAQANEMLLTALARSLAAWTGARSHLINLEGHGRENIFDDVDISRTVGWFTTHFPVLLEADAAQPPADVLRNVKEQLRRMPQHGIGYGLLRYLREEDELVASLRRLPQPEVSFNYLGQLDQTLRESATFGLRLEGGGLQRSPHARRSQLLQINAGITHGKLWVSWGYSENLHERATIETIARTFVESLQDLISDSETAGARSLTPSDFPEADLSARELEGLLARARHDMREQGTDAQVEDIYALSPMQEGMLFHSLHASESAAYFRQLSFKMLGRLDVERFERAWQKVFERHGVLRTAFLWEGLSNPVQVVHPHVQLPLEKLDWRGLSATAQEERWRTLLEAERERNFDTARAPLIRLLLVKLDEDSHFFAWSYHHLALEAWSRTQINREVLALYEAFSRGDELQLPAAVPYRKYIAWLRRQDMTKAEAFWRERLKDFRPPAPLSAKTPGETESAATPVETCVREHRLSRERTGALNAAARRHQLTLNTLVQGAWALWLSRYGGDDVAFGNVVSGRPSELGGVESMVGLFINTLPLRVRVPADARLLEWLRQIQRQQVEMSQYEYSPLVRIHGWSEIPRHVPLIQTVLNFGNYPLYPRESAERDGHLQIVDLRFVEGNHYPLALEVGPGEELLLRTLYDPRYFEADAIESMLKQVESLLLKMAENGECRLRDLHGEMQVEDVNFEDAPTLRDTEDDAEAQFTF